MRGLWHNVFALLLVLTLSFNKKTSASEETDAILEELSDALQKTPPVQSDALAVAKRDYSDNNEIPTEIASEDGSSKKASCRNLDSEDKCEADSINGLCKNSEMRKRCPRSCMVCCADLDAKFCSGIKQYCTVKRFIGRMKHMCSKTCGFCGKMPAPPPCLSSRFGCCWDKTTFASGPIGSGTENCPPCKNIKSDVFCKRFETDCYDLYKVKGKQMRQYCPQTCRLCGVSAICKDHPSQQYQCAQYKAEGLCESSSKIMSFWCSKTCGFCKCNDNPVANCAYLKAHRACTTSVQRMKVLCPSTCGFCSGGNKLVNTK